MRRPICFAAAVLGLAGCSRTDISPVPSITEESRAQLAAPVNCSTARQDIQLLEQERASVAQRSVAGVRSVFPIAAVAGMLSGDYSSRVAVASGKYNDDIHAKIEQIRVQCGL